MSEFRPLELSDRALFERYAAREVSRAVEANFVSCYIWQHKYRHELLATENALYVRTRAAGHPYIHPVGALDWTIVLKEAFQADPGAMLCDLSPGEAARLEAAAPGAFQFRLRRSAFDYLYRREDLAGLPGKKYHAKRNHCARFEREYAGRWRFEEISDRNMDDVWLFQDSWCRKNDCASSLTLQEEGTTIALLLFNLSALSARSGLLRVDGKVVAFTAGSLVGGDTIDVHIEKADYDVPGSYAMICREFARYACSDMAFLNREDDMGLDNLRKAKMAYYPAELLPKILAVPAGEPVPGDTEKWEPDNPPSQDTLE